MYEQPVYIAHLLSGDAPELMGCSGVVSLPEECKNLNDITSQPLKMTMRVGDRSIPVFRHQLMAEGPAYLVEDSPAATPAKWWAQRVRVNATTQNESASPYRGMEGRAEFGDEASAIGMAQADPDTKFWIEIPNVLNPQRLRRGDLTLVNLPYLVEDDVVEKASLRSENSQSEPEGVEAETPTVKPAPAPVKPSSEDCVEFAYWCADSYLEKMCSVSILVDALRGLGSEASRDRNVVMDRGTVMASLREPYDLTDSSIHRELNNAYDLLALTTHDYSNEVQELPDNFEYWWNRYLMWEQDNGIQHSGPTGAGLGDGHETD